jgi:membrane protease YdiL (CAAX protease family)
MILFPGTALGQGLFAFAKIWILLLPAGWFFVVERKPLPRHTTPAGGFRAGWVSGLAVSALIMLFYMLLGRQLIDGGAVRETAAEIGLARKPVYLACAAYWSFINSLLEEYVWRWFVVRQLTKLVRPGPAIALSAIAFALHHILAMQVYFTWPVTLLAAMGIALGGALWSWMFLRYKTIWPGWLSHVLVDITVFGLGHVLIFG